MSFILAALLITAMGSVLVYAVCRRSDHKVIPIEFFSLAFVTGAFLASCQLLVYHMYGADFIFRNVLVLPFACLLLCIYVALFRQRELRDTFITAGSFLGMTPPVRLFIAGILLQVAWVLFLTVPSVVHSHDAVANYALKAKIFFFQEGIPAGFFGWPETAVSHPDYPLFLPLVMTWVLEFTGFNSTVIKLVMPLFYLAFLGLFYSLLKRMFGRFYAVMMTFFLATIPQLADYATIMYTDLILSLYITCAVIYFVIYRRSGDRAALVFSSILFGSSLWIKNEALVFLAAYVFILLPAGTRKEEGAGRSLRDIALSLALVFIVASPWLFVKFGSGAFNSDIDLRALTPAVIWQNLKGIPMLLDLFQQEVFGPKKWNILWIAFFAALVWKRKALRESENRIVSAFLAFSCAGYFAAYMLMTGNDLFFYVNTTISRFMLHFAPLCLFLAGKLAWADVMDTPMGRRYRGAQKYVFLDRDGVINKDGYGWTPEGYITSWKDFHFVENSLKGISRLSRSGFLPVVISNQQCVGKRYMTRRALVHITDRMKDAVTRADGTIAAVYYCVHAKDKNCPCRKPRPGLFRKAMSELGITDPEGSYYIGDTERDMKAGREAGLKTILVLTGRTSFAQEIVDWETKPHHVCKDLMDAADIVTGGET